MNYMKILCTQSIKLGIDVDEKNYELRDYFVNELSAPFGSHCNVENCDDLMNLFKLHELLFKLTLKTN